MPCERRPAEIARRRLVRLLMLFYVALVVEGALRKWVFPEASNALVFIRDPLMLVILLAYLRLGPSEATRPVLGFAGAGVAALVLCAACQAATSPLPWPVLVAGLRNYALFMPLCCAIHDSFDTEDYRDWLRLNLLVALPIGGLVAMQYLAAPGAAINAVPGGGNDGVFLVVEDRVRPYGLFSFALGHSAFAAWMVGVGLAALIDGGRLRITPWLALPGLLGIAIMGAFSGSRTYLLLAASVVLGFAAAAAACGPWKIKAVALSALGAVSALGAGIVALAPVVLSDLQTRQAAALESEGSTLDRIATILTGFMAEAGRVPLFGQGVGAGTNIGTMLTTGGTDRWLAEYELTRIVQELGPIFGLSYIALRWSFLAWLCVMSLRAAARGNLQPACFLGLLVPVFLAHDITLQNTMIGIGWFSAGILMSAARVGGGAVDPVAQHPQPGLREAPA